MFKMMVSIAGIWLAFGSVALASEPIVVGVCLPLTGNLGAEGHAIWEGITIAHKLLPRVLGRTIQLRVADTRSEKAESANGVFRLVEKDRVLAVIGEGTSGNDMAGSFFAKRRGIPMVMPTAMSPLITEGKMCAFRFSAPQLDLAHRAAGIARDYLGARTAGIICDVSQEYSIALTERFRREFAQQGGKVVCETRVRPGQRDFVAQLQAMKKAAPDIIYAAIFPMESALFLRQAREMGVDVPIFAVGAAHASGQTASRGNSRDVTAFEISLDQGANPNRLWKDFHDLHEAELGTTPHDLHMRGAYAYFVVVQAIARAGSSDPARIREALASSTSYKDVCGTILLERDHAASGPVAAR
jgi:branched-chain amino acid transport system substrate-binding protein